MSTAMMLELFGYLGSALVIVSMLMTSVQRLRLINLIGSLLFSIYAILIHSYPTAVMNLFLAGINVYHLMRLRNTHKHYDLVRVSPGDGFLEYLLEYYREDIAGFFPDFAWKTDAPCDETSDLMACIICCDNAPAGIFIGRLEADVCSVVLDYTTPVYRDCSAGTFLYRSLSGQGIRLLDTDRSSDAHEAYLKKMGFEEGTDGRYCKHL